MTVRKITGKLPVGFRYTPGVANTAFFESLRDRGTFLGARCEECGITYVPPRMFCERCFEEPVTFVDCGPEGELLSFTVGHVGIDGDPLPEPVTLGLVKLDGADTVLMHYLIGDGPWEIGASVRAVLRPARTGSILDVEGFEPS